MKKTIFAAILTALMALPASAQTGGNSGIARDIIVTMQDISITADRSSGDQGIITIQNPIINYKIQKGKGTSEPLTLARFASLWTPNSEAEDSFAKVTPNAQLSFWDPTQENFYEAKFSIENVTIPEDGKLRLVVRFLDRQHPVHVLNARASVNSTAGQVRPAALSIAQIEAQLKQNRTSAVLIVDSNPWDPTAN